MKRMRKGDVLLPVGTAKGGFILRSDARRKKWSVEGPRFKGQANHHFTFDSRDGETLLASTFSEWWGCDIQRSRDGGCRWKRVAKGLPSRNAHLLVLREGMSVDSGERAGVYFGTSTGQLFHTRDEGNEWHLLRDFFPPIYSVEAFGPFD
jgi:hypothetical protein